ncbi:hypothetical protein B0H10DRAFT_2182960 [Mycena sp. CBHHK59/15]|nr:hypothetical protein B0H10DRAFT_2182960 [Mycena sp. CBHHK59/15]
MSAPRQFSLSLTTTTPPNNPPGTSKKRVKMAASKHTPADRDFLDGLSGRQLTEFRNYMYTPVYITSNAGRLLDQEWIDVPTLKQFLGWNVSDASHVASSTRKIKAPDGLVMVFVGIKFPYRAQPNLVEPNWAQPNPVEPTVDTCTVATSQPTVTSTMALGNATTPIFTMTVEISATKKSGPAVILAQDLV